MRFLLLMLSACTALAADPIQVLILAGQNNHDWRTTTPYIRSLLERNPRYRVKVTEEPGTLTAEQLAGYNVIVNNYNGPRWPRATETAIENFIKSGKGFVILHAASYAFGDMEILGDRHVRTGKREPPWTAYGDIAGATWTEGPPRSGHGKRHCFEVKWRDTKHPVAGSNFIACDELYHQLIVRPNIHLLSDAFDDKAIGGTGKNEPLLWTVNYGAGRVFQTALGHDVGAMQAPGFQASFLKGVEWAAAGVVSADPPPVKQVSVTVVTGGHDHDATFYGVFENQPGIRTNVVPHPTAFGRDLRKSTDVLVLYDMIQDVPPAQKKNLREYVESGRGLVVLHHAIASFNDWEWWYRDVLGGRYVLKSDTKASSYRHDVEMSVMPVLDHPVTRGVPPMRIIDETYKDMWISPSAKVLLKTDESTSDGPVAWISPYSQSRVVYIQLGHGREAHEHESFRLLVRNAILWTAGGK